MTERDNYLFLVTAPSMEEARKIGRHVVENKIAACANLISNISSIYRWKGKIEEDVEILLLIKTVEEKADEVIAAVEKIHSYDTPECIGFKIDKGSKKYLKWLDTATN
jgi:periplasmic divalent cation tolerance protein